jgi:hypothetical protein
MNVELSRRVAKIMNVIYREMNYENYIQFVDKIAQAESFDKLPLYYQQLILDAENKNMEKGIK